MIWRWLAVVLYAALLTVLLLVPDPLFFLRFGAVASPGPVGALMNDKVLHFCAYAGLGGLLTFAGGAGRMQHWFFLAVAHGAAMELLQNLVPPRQGDFADLGADAAGAFCGILAAVLIFRSR
ncbi:MAG TPA: VanZ family protein [Planctomycetia bacterium]|nr:VanZ family protein [Planctomycetia bacterium]